VAAARITRRQIRVSRDLAADAVVTVGSTTEAPLNIIP
jgi:hypothetical protein